MAGQITHYWDGTKLVVTSDSGTSSCDLKGDMGIRGPQGSPGIITDATGGSGGGSSWQEGYVKEATEYIVDIIYDEGGEDGKLRAEAMQVHLVLWRSNGYTPVIPMLAFRYYDGYTEDCIGVINARFDFNKDSDESGFLTMEDGMYDTWFSNMDGGEILSDGYGHDGEWTFEVLASKK